EGRLLCVAVFPFIRGSLFYTCHNVRGAAIQRGQNERLRSGQRGQPDVLYLRTAGHKRLLRCVAGEKTPKAGTDRQSQAR
ncbi:hypothetical protein XENOCAPTIV_023762, partial [Xenoophorus captivus]